jgi:ubiquinone/menaquinone biosynthesis C-methylase UbiE
MGDSRPLYHRFAWAYDLIVNQPIDARVAAIVSLFSSRGVRPPDEMLDVGCGTGRYTFELASRGFSISGIDSSAEMVEVARKQSLSGVKRTLM